MIRLASQAKKRIGVGHPSALRTHHPHVGIERHEQVPHEIVEAVHHRKDHDERRNPQGHARHRDAGDNRNQRHLPPTGKEAAGNLEPVVHSGLRLSNVVRGGAPLTGGFVSLPIAAQHRFRIRERALRRRAGQTQVVCQQRLIPRYGLLARSETNGSPRGLKRLVPCLVVELRRESSQ